MAPRRQRSSFAVTLVAAALLATTLLASAAASAAQQQQQGGRPLLGLDRQNKQLRVLAHGDSITEGWINSAWTKTPWSPLVERRLREKLGPDWQVAVVNGGLGGSGVTGGYGDAKGVSLYDLLQRQLGEARAANKPYHYIIFEGGINDISPQFGNKGAQEIFARMKEMWAIANAEGATVLVIPTLPTNMQGAPEATRQQLTRMQRDYIAAQRAAGNDGLVLLDMERYFDWPHLTEQRRAELFDDGIHLTQRGYELMGELAAQGVLRTIVKI